jgi:hypothetical protein
MTAWTIGHIDWTQVDGVNPAVEVSVPPQTLEGGLFAWRNQQPGETLDHVIGSFDQWFDKRAYGSNVVAAILTVWSSDGKAMIQQTPFGFGGGEAAYFANI